MNQILEPNNNFSNSSEDISNNNINENSKKKTKKHKNINRFKIQFFSSSIIAFIFIFIFFIQVYNENEKESLSEELLNNYHISTLYNNTSSYSAAQTTGLNNSEFSNTSNNNPFVIGMIRIDKIGLNYPILSQSNYDFLKISLCRFAGPMPNEVGNLCIAGHNYVDYKFFSRLNELEIGNKIKIYDLSGKLIEYKVYKKYEVKPNNISCTNQDTNGKTLLTLSTCNNVNGKRLIIKAEAITKK